MTYFPWLSSLAVIIYIEQTHSKNIHNAYRFHQNISKYFLAELSFIRFLIMIKGMMFPFKLKNPE